MSELGISPWLDARTAAAYCGRTAKNSYRWILRMAKQGKVRAGWDGCTWRFKEEDLDAFLYLSAKEAVR